VNADTAVKKMLCIVRLVEPNKEQNVINRTWVVTFSEER
jgi:hypothetical protein